MNLDTFEAHVGKDDAVRMAHVRLHKNNGQVTVFAPQAEENDEEGDILEADVGKALPSRYHQYDHKAMVSYIIPKDTEGLITATEIHAPDLNVAPLLSNGNDLELIKKAKPFISPRGRAMVKVKPKSDEEMSTRSKKRRRQRVAKGLQLTLPDGPPAQNTMELLFNSGVTLPEELRDNIKDTTDTAKEKGIPVWEHLLDTLDVTVGRRSRAKSLTTYRTTDTQGFDREEVSASLRTTAKQHVADAQQELAKVFHPNGDQIMIELHKFLASRPHCRDENGQLLPAKLKEFRDWLVYSQKMLTSVKKVENVIYQEHLVVSTGLIPVTPLRLIEEDLEKLRLQEDKEPYDDDLTPEQRMEKRNRRLAEKAEAFRRIARPIENVHQKPAIAEKREQSEDNYARLQITVDPNVRSHMVIRHTVNYRDEAVPEAQPCHKSRIELTYLNTCGPRDEGMGETQYVTTHRVVDVSDKAWQSSLEKIFPQTTKVKDYYRNLYGSIQVSGSRLYLVTIELNGMDSTTNLLTENRDVPPLVKDLRIVAKIPTMVFMLLRTISLPSQIEGLVQEFKKLCRYDPMNDFFVDPYNPSLTHTGVKPTMELPKFTAIPQIQYESWNDCKRQTGLAALIEQRSSVEDHHYTAKAAMVPVPATQKKDAKVFMAYHIQAVIERDQTKPRLMPGNPVMIDLHPDSENSSDENAWHGKVTHPTGATPMGMTNIVI